MMENGEERHQKPDEKPRKLIMICCRTEAHKREYIANENDQRFRIGKYSFEPTIRNVWEIAYWWIGDEKEGKIIIWDDEEQEVTDFARLLSDGTDKWQEISWRQYYLKLFRAWFEKFWDYSWALFRERCNESSEFHCLFESHLGSEKPVKLHRKIWKPSVCSQFIHPQDDEDFEWENKK